ncbi:hypothetical protein EVAR_63732_1 [Eumeta japonica]|uniref:Uncharacterized protein n=1 Tax=Eumeta variegata TaxID=151549 RepID=A0A4C1ZJE3_EUMVA|nr:hypothetical protein EVAR_63732_1 [Eumeta japonica]
MNFDTSQHQDARPKVNHVAEVAVCIILHNTLLSISVSFSLSILTPVRFFILVPVLALNSALRPAIDPDTALDSDSYEARTNLYYSVMAAPQPANLPVASRGRAGE